MEADIHTLYKSDFYQVLDFKCRCTECVTSKPEYNYSFCVSFVRKGNFIFNVFRHSLDSYTGCVLITKPGYERTVKHTHTVPDECTIFEFTEGFYTNLLHQVEGLSFFHNHDLHSTLVKTTAETEFLHTHVVRCILTQSGSKLLIDNMVIELIEKVLENIGPYSPDVRINQRLKKNHLLTIESAKEYMTSRFTEDMSLTALADHCNVSTFHFSRIFKMFTGVSPHQFLLTVRLKHAEMLLKDTVLPVADVAFSSGFNSIEYFTSAFRQKYRYPPATFRQQRVTV